MNKVYKIWDMKIEAVAAIDQCTTQHAQNVGKHARYLSNQRKEDQYTAKIVINQNQDTDSIHLDDGFFFFLFFYFICSNFMIAIEKHKYLIVRFSLLIKY